MQVHFMEVLHALSGLVAGVELPAEAEIRLHGMMLAVLPDESGSPAKFNAAHVYAAMTVASAVQGHLQRYRLQQQALREEEALRRGVFGDEDEEGEGGAPRPLPGLAHMKVRLM